MLVAAGQFAVTSVWEKNAEICASLMAQAAENDVSLLCPAGSIAGAR